MRRALAICVACAVCSGAPAPAPQARADEHVVEDAGPRAYAPFRRTLQGWFQSSPSGGAKSSLADYFGRGEPSPPTSSAGSLSDKLIALFGSSHSSQPAQASSPPAAGGASSTLAEQVGLLTRGSPSQGAGGSALADAFAVFGQGMPGFTDLASFSRQHASAKSSTSKPALFGGLSSLVGGAGMTDLQHAGPIPVTALVQTTFSTVLPKPPYMTAEQERQFKLFLSNSVGKVFEHEDFLQLDATEQQLLVMDMLSEAQTELAVFLNSEQIAEWLASLATLAFDGVQSVGSHLSQGVGAVDMLQAAEALQQAFTGGAKDLQQLKP